MNHTPGLYHKKIGLPSNYRHPNCVVPVEWTRHAIKAAGADRYGIIETVPQIDLRDFETIEVELHDENGAVSKILVRGAYDNFYDVTYALIPLPGRKWVVKTCWKNVWNDQHRLISRDKYVNGVDMSRGME